MTNTSMGSCPFGGLWWTCEVQTPTFFGCCVSNPCNGIGCPQSDLRAAGMGTGRGPDSTVNDGSYWPNSQCPQGGKWYTCSKQSPSFQGCCDSNPCNGLGTPCPSGQLHAAGFQSVPAVISTWTSSASTVPATVTATPSVSSSASVSSSGPSNSQPIMVVSSDSKSTTPIAAIVGGAVGGAIAITGLVLVFLWFRKYQREQPPSFPENLEQNGSLPPTFQSSNAFLPGFDDPKDSIKGYRPLTQITDSPQFSPLPPSYRSPSPSSPAPPFHHEIDSTTVFEVESPDLRQGGFMSNIAELPDTPRMTPRIGAASTPVLK